MSDISILKRIRAHRLTPKKFNTDSDVEIRAYKNRTALYYHNPLLLEYKFVAVSIVDTLLYLECTNQKQDDFYAITRKAQTAQTAIGGNNGNILTDYAGKYKITVLSTGSNSLVVKLIRK